MIFLATLSGEQLAFLAAAFASVIGSDFSADENDLLGSFFVSLGDALSLIAARQALDEKTKEPDFNNFNLKLVPK